MSAPCQCVGVVCTRVAGWGSRKVPQPARTFRWPSGTGPSEVSDLYAWCDEYLDLLPPAIRSTTDDSRLVAGARRARDNGWTAQHAARIVAGTNYSTAINPPLIALMHLERIGERAPLQRRQAADASGCIVCPPGTRCNDRVTEQDRIPVRWVVQRFALLRELLGTKGMAEDERAHTMDVLIAHQKEEG